MSTLQTHTIYTDIMKVLPQIVQHPGVSPLHPVYTSSPYYSKFEWGKVPADCKVGEAIVYAFPNRNTKDAYSFQESINRVSFVIGVLQDAEINLEMFQDFWAKLHNIFDTGYRQFKFSTNGLLLHGETIAAPWTLGSIGVAESKILSESQPINIRGENCALYRVQMVVEWSFYTSSFTKQVLA